MKSVYTTCALLLACAAQAQNESYHGGTGDGYALTEQITPFSNPASFQPYIGNSGDGYALSEQINQVFDFPYTFSAFLGGTGDGWTSVLKPNIVVLPLTLLQFGGHATGYGNELAWRTEAEVNTSYFSVERSSDGSRFVSLGRVTARGSVAGSSSYTFVDSTPPQGRAYYRLQMADRNGAFRYSAVILLQQNGSAVLQLYPNPTQGSLYLHFSRTLDHPVFCTVTGVNGQKIAMQQIAPGASTYLLDVRTLPPGAYMLQLDDGEQRRSLNFVKQ